MPAKDERQELIPVTIATIVATIGAVLQSMNAFAGVNSSPCASATGLQVILPSQTLRPSRKIWLQISRCAFWPF